MAKKKHQLTSDDLAVAAELEAMDKHAQKHNPSFRMASPRASATSATAQFESVVDTEIKRTGMPRHVVWSSVCRSHSELRKRMVAEANENPQAINRQAQYISNTQTPQRPYNNR